MSKGCTSCKWFYLSVENFQHMLGLISLELNVLTRVPFVFLAVWFPNSTTPIQLEMSDDLSVRILLPPKEVRSSKN